MANVVVAENHLTFGGLRYFRGGAHLVKLLDTGEKKTPLTAQNYLEVKGSLPPAKAEVVKSDIIQIDFSKSTKTSFGAKVAAIVQGVPVQLDADDTISRLRDHELELVLFSLDLGQMKKIVNGAPQARNELVEWGNDARAVSQAFFVMSAKEASLFGHDANVSLSAGVKGIEAKVAVGSTGSGSSTVVLPKGMCFAYMLAKFQWNASQKKNVTAAEDVDSDPWSI